MKYQRTFIIFALALASFGANAQSVAVPFTFQSGQPARAADVNANFATLVAAVNSLSAKLDKTSSFPGAADIPGTYKIVGTKTILRNLTSEVKSITGSLVLSSDNTASVTTTETGYTNGTGIVESTPTSTSNSIASWAVTNGALNITANGITTTWLSGGSKTFVSTNSADGDHSTSLLVLIRQ
jgi:hypothetical protein